MERTVALRTETKSTETRATVEPDDRHTAAQMVGNAGLRVRPDVGLTFDDVLLIPRFSSLRSRQDTDTRTLFSRRIELHIPIVSSNMDTVTESEMAIAMARHGGIGVIHRFMTAGQQANEVRRVKRAEALVVEHPLTVAADATVARVRHEMEDHGIGGMVVVDVEGFVQGIVTRRDIMFVEDGTTLVSAVMTGKDNLITAPKGTTFEEARAIIDRNRVEKLPLVDDEGRLAGLITAKDIEQLEQYPRATKDAKGHLRVAAAVGVRPGYLERAEVLLAAGADALVIDIAHGDSTNAIEASQTLRRKFGDAWDLVVGNVATGDGARRLVDVGADAVKVGVGPGSICITRLVTGFGAPQLSAIAECAVALPSDVPMIADGGIRNSGDMVKALAAGAQNVMIGSLFAGTRESPGIVVVRSGRRYKQTRGMASLGATMSRDRSEGDPVSAREYERVVPEGVEASVPYRGPIEDILHQLVGGLRSGLSYGGARNIEELRRTAEFVRLTPAGMKESGPHDVHAF
jgi:IMP dehydrogenase